MTPNPAPPPAASESNLELSRRGAAPLQRFRVHDSMGNTLLTLEALDRGAAEVQVLELYGPATVDLYVNPVHPAGCEV